MLTEEQVRAQAERALGHPIPEPIWRRVVKKNYVREVQEGYDRAFQELVDECKSLEKLVRECSAAVPVTAGRQHEVLPDRRLLALSRILAAEAEGLPEVVKFRQEVLGGRLLAPEEVKPWVESQAERERPAKGAVPRPVSVLEVYPAHKKDSEQWLTPEDQIVHQKNPPFPGENGWIHRVVIHSSTGVLARLKDLAVRLCRRYPIWQEAQAVGFILTGMVPLVPKARVTVTFGVGLRITLNLDPWLPVNEVAKIYSHYRQEFFPGQGGHPIGEKNLSLAVFVVENERPGATWGALMAEWNQTHPEWAYSDRHLFARDARASIERIAGRKWRLGGRSQKDIKQSGRGKSSPYEEDTP